MAWKRYACAAGFGRLAVITAIAAAVVIAVIVIVVIVYLASLGLPACIPCLFGFASFSDLARHGHVEDGWVNAPCPTPAANPFRGELVKRRICRVKETVSALEQ